MAFAAIYQLGRTTDVAVKEFVRHVGARDSRYSSGNLGNCLGRIGISGSYVPVHSCGDILGMCRILETDATINKHSDLPPTLKPKISKTSKQMNTLNSELP